MFSYNDMSKARKRAFDKLDKRWTRYGAEGSKILHDIMLKEITAFKKQFPKRRFHFMDAMGAQVIWIDDIDATFPAYPHNDQRFDRIFKPMRDLVTWYCHMADHFQVEIEDINL